MELANLLVAKYDVTLVVLQPCGRSDVPYRLDDKVELLSMDSSFTILNFNNIIKLRRILKVIKPEAVVTVATPLVRVSAPAIIGLGIRNIAWEHFNLYAGSKIGSCWKWLSTYCVDKTVVLCEDDAVNYRKVKASNIMVIPNFSSIGEEYEPSDCRSKTLLAVGRHSTQKGFDMLIRAWAKVDAKDWTLKIVGSGHLYDENLKLVEELGVVQNIIFQDATPDIVSEYRNASCFVLSSRYEGLVMVLIEARMMGLTCVSFDCPTGPREIIRDTVDGFLVPPEDVDALAAKLSEVLAYDNLKAFGSLAREDAMKRYGAEAASKMWEEILKPKKK